MRWPAHKTGGPGRTTADIKEETEAHIPYQPCPANVRFPSGQQSRRKLGRPLASAGLREPKWVGQESFVKQMMRPGRRVLSNPVFSSE
jgi:hypothetical protein